MNSLFLILLVAAGWIAPPAPFRIEAVRAYSCQDSMGYSTASAGSHFAELQGKCPFGRALSPAQAQELGQLLARASTRRHWQQKLGKNLIFCEFTVAGAPHQVLMSTGGTYST